MATFPVKYIHNNMRGAPQVSGTPGTLLAALRAFLITGFGQVTALSVTVAGGVATASLQAGQSFDPYCVVLVEGATPAELNGEARVLTASGSSITWATTAADGPATGSIKIKVAPVGQWEEVFADTNTAVFRSTDIQGPRFFWKVADDTSFARVCGYEAMTDVITGVGPFPSPNQIPGGGYWIKAARNKGAGSPVPYRLFADSRTLLVAISAAGTPGQDNVNAGACVRGWGDMLALAPGGDVWSACISVGTREAVDYQEYGAEGSFLNDARPGSGGVYAARAISGLGGAVNVKSRAYIKGGTTGRDGALGLLSGAIDGRLRVSPHYLTCDSANFAPRADVPGLYHIPQSVGDTVRDGDILTNVEGGLGGVLLAVGAGASGLSDATGVALIDIIGPWR